ncbi:hypothetical protein PFISCL1PPCAC_9315, partial [Pristionchus fissidentatus]
PFTEENTELFRNDFHRSTAPFTWENNRYQINSPTSIANLDARNPEESQILTSHTGFFPDILTSSNVVVCGNFAYIYGDEKLWSIDMRRFEWFVVTIANLRNEVSLTPSLSLLTIVNYSPLVMELTRRHHFHFDMSTIRIAAVPDELALLPIEEGMQNLQIEQGEDRQAPIELERKVDELSNSMEALRTENGELKRRLDEIEKKNEEKMEKMERKYRQMLMMMGSHQ